MFGRVYFEISGICNGRCFWCHTGIKNINRTASGKYVDFEEFKRSVHYLRENGFMSRDSEIALYNWGEPFLLPDSRTL